MSFTRTSFISFTGIHAKLENPLHPFCNNNQDIESATSFFTYRLNFANQRKILVNKINTFSIKIYQSINAASLI